MLCVVTLHFRSFPPLVTMLCVVTLHFRSFKFVEFNPPPFYHSCLRAGIRFLHHFPLRRGIRGMIFSPLLVFKRSATNKNDITCAVRCFHLTDDKFSYIDIGLPICFFLYYIFHNKSLFFIKNRLYAFKLERDKKSCN